MSEIGNSLRNSIGFHEKDIKEKLNKLQGLSSNIPEVRDLNEEIRKSIKELEGLITDLKLLGEEQYNPKDKARILEQVQVHESSVKKFKTSLGHATLLSKGNIERKQMTERDELLRNRKNAPKDTKNLQKNSVELTQAMKTTLEILQNSVSKSEAAVQELDISTQSIKTLNREYKIYDSVMRQSKNILSRLKKKDIMDKLVLYICFLIFLLTCAYIIWKRIYIPGFSSRTDATLHRKENVDEVANEDLFF